MSKSTYREVHFTRWLLGGSAIHLRIHFEKKETMKTQDFTTAILVDRTPKQAFDAVTNVRGWWSEEIKGDTDRVDAVFHYHYEDIHRCEIRILELVPGKKVVWRVEKNFFSFTEDKKEWTGTNVIFEIVDKAGKTEIRMTHVGLVPEYECFDVCKEGWTNYVQNSLRQLIMTGKGKPNATGKPQTETERKLTIK